MRKLILNTFTLLSICFVILILLGYFLEYRFSKDYTDKITWGRSISNHKFDYAYLGSSRTFNMIDIEHIDSIYNTVGINLGVGGADYKTIYMLLTSFIEIQQNDIDLIYLEIDPFMIYTDSVYNRPDFDHYFYSQSNNRRILDCIEKKKFVWIYSWFPIIKYIEYNKVYNLTHFIRSFQQDYHYSKSKGTTLLKGKMLPEQGKIEKKSHNISLNELDYTYLNKTIEFLIKHQIKLILYTAPIYKYEETYKYRYPKFEMQVNKVLHEHSLEYFDFTNAFDDKIFFFKDPIHLNKEGSVTLSKEISDRTAAYLLDTTKK